MVYTEGYQQTCPGDGVEMDEALWKTRDAKPLYALRSMTLGALCSPVELGRDLPGDESLL